MEPELFPARCQVRAPLQFELKAAAQTSDWLIQQHNRSESAASRRVKSLANARQAPALIIRQSGNLPWIFRVAPAHLVLHVSLASLSGASERTRALRGN